MLGSSRITGKIINNGTVRGASAILIVNNSGTPVTIDNYGTLDGNFYATNSILNIENGSIIHGNVVGVGTTVNINTDFTASGTYGTSGSPLAGINIAAGKTLTATHAAPAFAATNFVNDGTLHAPTGQVIAIEGSYTQAANATFSLSGTSASTYSKLNVSGTANLVAGTGIFVDVAVGNSFLNNDLLTSVIAAGTLNASTFNVTDNSALFNFMAIINGNSVDLKAIAESQSGVADAVRAIGNNPAFGAAQALDSIIAGTPSGDMQTVVNALTALTNDNDVSSAVTQTLPILTGGTTQATLQTMSATGQIVQARIDSNQGLSSGDGILSEQSIWMKPFGTWTDQARKDNVAGHDARSLGMVAGMDGIAGENARLGMALSYAHTGIHSDDKRNRMRVNSWQATAYGSYSLDDRTELNIQAGAGFNHNNSHRRIFFGGLDRTATADYNSYSTQIGGGIGKVYDITGRTRFVPSARVDYAIIHNAGYTETGGGGLSLKVKSQSTDQLIPSVSAKLDHDLNNSISITGTIGAGYDVLNDRSSVTSSYLGGGPAFVTEGQNPSPWVLRSGLGLSWKPNDAYDINLRYDREDHGAAFHSQTATVRIRALF